MLMNLFVGNRYGVFTSERRNSTEHFIHHNAKRVNVAALVCRCTLSLFGGEVCRRAHDCTSLCESLFNSCTKRTGNTKVGDFHLTCCADKNIARFNIAVDHAIVVRRNQRRRNFADEIANLHWCECATLL